MSGFNPPSTKVIFNIRTKCNEFCVCSMSRRISAWLMKSVSGATWISAFFNPSKTDSLPILFSSFIYRLFPCPSSRPFYFLLPPSVFFFAFSFVGHLYSPIFSLPSIFSPSLPAPSQCVLVFHISFIYSWSQRIAMNFLVLCQYSFLIVIPC